MNQLFTFNSEQFTANLRPALTKKTPPEEQTTQIRADRNAGTFRSRKQIKRYELIMEAASRNAGRLQGKKPQLTTTEQLRNYVAGHFSNSAVSLEPAALKLLPRRDTGELRAKSKRCNSEMGAIKPPENMLFTFYPREGEPNETLTSTDLSQEADPHRLQLRSLSLKNAPIVDYRSSNKLLPRVFRGKGRPEEDTQLRRKNLSELSAGEEGGEREGALRELNRAERRNFCIKNCGIAMRNRTEVCGNERLHPLKHIQLRAFGRNQ